MSDMKPCPFCGGYAHEVDRELVDHPDFTEEVITVGCFGCGCRMPSWDAWNMRVAPGECTEAEE